MFVRYFLLVLVALSAFGCGGMRRPLAVELVPESVEFVEPPCPNAAIDGDFYGRVLDALVDHSSKSRFLSWENDYGNPDGRPGNVRVTYTYQGNHYTVWYNTPLEHSYGTVEGWLEIRARPSGSVGLPAIDTWSDTSFTGCVNFGIGSVERFGWHQKALNWHDVNIEDEDYGLEYHTFWQEHHAEAVDGLAAVLDVR